MKAVIAFSTSVFLIGTAAAADAPVAARATAAVPVMSGTVTRAQLTSGIRNREPTDKIVQLTNQKTYIYFYTELKDMAGAKLAHRWEYKDQILAEIPIEVGSARWRAWSSKSLDPAWTGEWKVSVIDSAGKTLSVQTFTYSAPHATAAIPAQ